MSRDDRLGVVEASLTKTDACKANASVIYHETISLSRPRHKTLALGEPSEKPTLAKSSARISNREKHLSWGSLGIMRVSPRTVQSVAQRAGARCAECALSPGGHQFWVWNASCVVGSGAHAPHCEAASPGLDQVRGWDLRAFLFLVTTCCTSGQCHTSVYCSETSVTSLDHTRPCKLARSH